MALTPFVEGVDTGQHMIKPASEWREYVYRGEGSREMEESFREISAVLFCLLYDVCAPVSVVTQY